MEYDMNFIDNYKYFAYSLFGFAIFVGVVKLFVPKNFSGIVKTISEILMFVVFASIFIRPQYFELENTKEYSKLDYSDIYNNVQIDAIKNEVEKIVLEKLSQEGIIPIAIRIDISISENTVEIPCCYIKFNDEQRTAFTKKKNEIEAYFGFPFYEAEEDIK